MTLARPMPAVDMEFIKARCTECDGCLIWNGPFEAGPKLNFKRTTYKVRHIVFCLTHGRAPARKYIPMPTVCNENDCVEPTHMRLVTRNGHTKGTKRTLAERNRIAMTKRAAAGKITMEVAEAIRTSSATLAKCARENKISTTNAGLIRRNQAWIDYSNPYLQLAGAA